MSEGKKYNAVTLTLKRGKTTKRFTIQNPPSPLPRIGDEITLAGQAWLIQKVKPCEVFAAFSVGGGKMKQVFP